MVRIRHIALSVPLVVFSSVTCPGADSPAISALKEKGLTRSGRLFVLEAEESVLKKWNETRAVLADYGAAAGRKDEADWAARRLAELEERRTELQQGLDELNLRTTQPVFPQGNNRPGGFGQGPYLDPVGMQREMIRRNLAEVVATQRSLKSGGTGADAKALEAEAAKKYEAAKAALTQYRASVDAVLKRYEELNADTSVRSALLALEKDRLGTFRLGPSTTFKAAVKALESAERRVLGKRPATVTRKKSKSRK